MLSSDSADSTGSAKMRPLLPALCRTQNISALRVKSGLSSSHFLLVSGKEKLAANLSFSTQPLLKQTECTWFNRYKSTGLINCIPKREMSQLLFDDKVAIVTGAGGGIS